MCDTLIVMGIKTIQNRDYSGIPLGILVRGKLAGTRIFRVRRGNGHYSADPGAHYQDQYAYFVPASISNPESEPYRAQFKAAVAKWKFDLTNQSKIGYNRLAAKGLRMSGYNLFMRKAMKGEIPMYVDRGDPAAYDFTLTDFTTDETWRDLDLSGIVPSGAAAVHLRVEVADNTKESTIKFRKKGNTNDINTGEIETRDSKTPNDQNLVVANDTNRVIQYWASNTSWTAIDFVVCGWWT